MEKAKALPVISDWLKTNDSQLTEIRDKNPELYGAMFSALNYLNKYLGAKKTLETCKLVYLECPIIANFNNNNLNIFDYLNYLKNLDYIPQEICEIHHYHGYLIQVDILFVKKNFYKNINFDLDLLKSLY